MNATKHSLDDGSPPPYKRARRVSCSDNNRSSVRCEHSAEECLRLLQCKDTVSEALDALLQHQELLMRYTRINGAYFYLTYALAHATKDSPQLCAKVFQVMGSLLSEDATRALRATGATTHIHQAMQHYPHLQAYGSALLQAMGEAASRRVTLDESSLRSDAMEVSCRW